MYLDGTPSTTHGTPSLDMLKLPASVPPLLRTVTWYGMPSLMAVSMARSASLGFMMALGSWSLIWTPPPSLPWLSEGLKPGVSSAGGPSRMMATSGLAVLASERAPRRPTSS